jgi:hypothetical protein
MWRLDNVVVHGKDRVFHLAPIRVGQEEFGIERSGNHVVLLDCSIPGTLVMHTSGK